MNVYVNNRITEVDKGITLSKLIEFLKITYGKGIAIALNGSVISKTNWEKTYLKEGDKILIIKATQGG
ncbi:MAG: hypothetical protein Kow0068_01850 [Marinilabiliales bacterium]